MTLYKPNLPIKKSEEEILLYMKYGKKFNEILLHLKVLVEEGIEWDLEKKFTEISEDILSNQDDIKSISYPFKHQKNYLGREFGHAICMSINNVVAHGEPTILKTGDTVSVDCGLFLCFKNGSCLNFDSAFTGVFGEKLDKDSWIYKSKNALNEIEIQQPKDTKSISKIIRHVAKDSKLKQVVSMTGHGIGHNLHEPPSIHNAPADFNNIELFEGLVFCAEPIFVKSDEDFEKFIVQTALGSNGWEVLTTSDEMSTHFETMFCFVNGQIIDLIGVSKWIL